MQTRIAFIIMEFLLLCRLRHGTAQQQGDLRLTNGTISNNRFGRLEIYDSSTDRWATICIEGFTMISANTACKQLGRAGAESFGLAETMGFGIGVGDVGLTQVVCGEDDNHILRCFAMGINPLSKSCNHTQDVGIICSTEAAFQYEGGVRLAYGQYSSEGILEVFIFNQWYTLCIDELPASAVTAVCTQLGYTNYVEFSDVSFQATATSVWRTSPNCAFSTSCFSRCYSRPQTEDDVEDNCTPDTYVHITCEFDSRLTEENPAGKNSVCDLGPVFESLRHGDLRLENGRQYSGRLEIYDSTRDELPWGTICIEKFTLESANTACRQLGYARAVQFGKADELGYGIGSGPILFTDVQCDEFVNHILRCFMRNYNTFLSSCTHEEDVGIICGKLMIITVDAYVLIIVTVCA